MSTTSSSDDYLSDLTLLKHGETKYPTSPDDAELETFGNRFADRDYWITFDCPEFTALCPVTSQPDFGHIAIKYIPGERCIESKSLKLYLFSFRNYNTFHEDSVNRIRDDVIAACQPRKLVVTGQFRPRGGIAIHVEAAYESP